MSKKSIMPTAQQIARTQAASAALSDAAAVQEFKNAVTKCQEEIDELSVILDNAENFACSLPGKIKWDNVAVMKHIHAALIELRKKAEYQ